MDTPKIFESEYRFCLLLWEHEPINSTQLAALCKEKLGWSKATTYTVLRKLCEKGLFQNVESRVSALIDKETYCHQRGERFVEENYGGSLPSMIAAFMSRKKLNSRQVEEIRRLIEEYEGGEQRE